MLPGKILFDFYTLKPLWLPRVQINKENRQKKAMNMIVLYGKIVWQAQLSRKRQKIIN